MATVGIVHNATFISSGKPSDGTLHSPSNQPWWVQVSSFAMILSLRSAALALIAPLVILMATYSPATECRFWMVPWRTSGLVSLLQ